MDGSTLGSLGAALLGTGVYYVAFVLFRHAALRMPPLRGGRPFQTAWSMLADGVWFMGGLMLFVGLAYQVIAFLWLPLGVAQPAFAASLLVLIAYSAAYLGERLSRREWVSVGLFGAAIVMLGLSGGQRADELDASAPSLPLLALVVIPPLLIAGLVWLVGDRRRGGRHAKPLAGVAYGIGAGVGAGVAETGIRGIAAVWASQESVLAVLESPYPYLTLGMAGISLLQLQVALQRCRLVIVAVILTVTGRAMLVLCSTVLFDEPWPEDTGPLLLRYGGFALLALGIFLFPRHELPRSSVPTLSPLRRIAEGRP
ncbi:hypothetical protein EDD29_5783 [Actinocorallia herbida]|uniref:Magnesium transporter NIPA n=1 Tax=Actinocorallia herbida TaxID=58109 RepID=A0A3N1D3K5_9ACTN|nr:hypothetical protein [Actinocorallia herbida]ROO88123.1 hypothetical protein EDD29_5783 [Actinocorallia herbida]